MLMNSLIQFLPILILLLVVSFVLSKLPKVALGHSAEFKRRRVFNWLPLGLTYAFLYMGRYNLTVAKTAFGDAMTKADFGQISLVGALVYAFSFLINGPLTDKFGGRKAIMLAAGGATVANMAMGLVTMLGYTENLVLTFSILFGLNMYFQSFGAVAIVKVNAGWFHVRERGTFGGIFGILISLGLYFAYDVGGMITKNLPLEYVFIIPATILIVFFILCFKFVRDTPEEAGLKNFDTGEAKLSGDGEKLSPVQILGRMAKNPVIVTIAMIELCSGFLRNGIMKWYFIFANETGIKEAFVASNWGMLSCCAGITGGIFAGTLSDKIFGSRRGPMSAILYMFMILGGLGMYFTLTSSISGWIMVFMSMSIIGVHGMLSGTASMDFGGRKHVGFVVGVIDGMVYLGDAIQSKVFGEILPSGEAQKDPANWTSWPMALVVVSGIGFVLAARIWNAHPTSAAHKRKETKIPVTLTAEKA